MEFNTDKVDYSVPEFFEQFSVSLPKIVVVSQGYYGDILQDTFDRDQVLRIHTFSRQKRVIAKKSEDTPIASRYFSIPLDYPVRMCVVKQKGKMGKEKTLEEIVRDNPLPVDVHFAKGGTVTVGSKTISSRHFPQLNLTNTFEEIYMLGNFIVNGVIQLKPEAIPLYLTEMRLAEVIGIKDQPLGKWRSYKESVTEQVESSVTFDRSYGNKEVAVYHPDAIKADSVYSYIAPRHYTSFAAIIQHQQMVVSDTKGDSYEAISVEADTNVYEQIQEDLPSAQGTSKSSEKPPKPTEKPPRPEKPKNDEGTMTSELATALKARASKIEGEETPPRLAPKPGSPGVRRASEPPTVPHRQTPISGSFLESPSQQKKDTHPYKNDIPRREVTPTKIPPPTPEAGSTTSVASKGDMSQDATSPPDPTKPVNVASLSISELGDWLGKLNLSKYCSKFKDELVDGTVLLQLDEQIMWEEFGMKKLEILRLMNFAQKGHVPK